MSSEEHLLRRMAKRASSIAESSRSFRVKGKGLRRQTSMLELGKPTEPVGEESVEESSGEESFFLSRFLSNKKLELEVRTCRMQLKEAMMSNSKLDDAKMHLEYTVEVLKNSVSDMEEQVSDLKHRLHSKTRELIGYQYGNSNSNRVDDSPDISSQQQSDLLEENAPSPDQSDRLKLALNQWDMAEAELSAVIDENLVLSRERDAAIALVHSLKETVAKIEIERDKALLDLAEKTKKAERLANDNDELVSKLKKNVRDAATMTALEPLVEETESRYSDNDLEDAFNSIDEEEETVKPSETRQEDKDDDTSPANRDSESQCNGSALPSITEEEGEEKAARENTDLRESISSPPLPNDVYVPGSILVSASSGSIGHHAGSMPVDESVLTVSWPDEVVYESTTQEIFCAAVQGNDHGPSLRSTDVLLSPIVYASPRVAILRRAVTIEVPHCALIDSGGWRVTVVKNSSLLSEEPLWEPLASWTWPKMGQDENCQLSSEVFRVDTCRLEAYAMIGCPIRESSEEEVHPMKRLSLMVFGKIFQRKTGECVRLKVACSSDLREQQKYVEQREQECGWKEISSWASLVVTGDGNDIEVGLAASSVEIQSSANEDLPFDAFWPGIECPFVTFDVVGLPEDDFGVSFNMGQRGEAGEHDEQSLSFTVSLKSLRSSSTVLTFLASPGRAILPFSVAAELGCLLDPDHPLGNDWRHVAYILGLSDSERRALERAKHPTQYILSKLPVLGQNRNTLQGLLDALFRIERPDAVNVVADYLNSL